MSKANSVLLQYQQVSRCWTLLSFHPSTTEGLKSKMAENRNLIAGLVKGLVPGPSTSQGDIQEAKVAIAQAVLTGQVPGSFGLIPSVDTMPNAMDDHSAEIEELLASGSSLNESPKVVFRPSTLSVSALSQRISAIGTNQVPVRSSGLLVDRLGRTGILHVFTPTNMTPLRFSSNSDPYLYYSTPRITGSPLQSTFGAGSVWLAAQSFTSASMPADSFIGFKVATWSIQTILLAPPIRTNIILNLASSPNPAAAVPGLSVAVPTRIVFVMAPTSATFAAASDASLTVFGTTAKLHFSGGSPTYDSFLNYLHFPMTSDITSFQANQPQSGFVPFAGMASIRTAAWSIPVTVSSSKTFSEADGAGTLSLILDPGLTAQPPDSSAPVSCGPSTILAQNDAFLVAGQDARQSDVPRVVQVGTLRKQRSDDQTMQVPSESLSTLTFRTPKPFKFMYIYQTDKNEVWSQLADMVSSLDQPRTINNLTVPYFGPGHFELTKDFASDKIDMSFGADPDNELSDIGPFGYALKNMLLVVWSPNSMVGRGSYMRNVISAGKITIHSNLERFIPFLPDPYTTNISWDLMASDTSLLGELSVKLTWDLETPTVVDISMSPSVMFHLKTFSNPTAPESSLGVDSEFKAMTEGPNGLAPLEDASVMPTLLDLSTNVSQFGVVFSPKATGFEVVDLSLQTQSMNLRIYTLPAVQWEPIAEERAGALPGTLSSKFQFPYAGPATNIASDSVVLTPVAPREAIDGALSRYGLTPSTPVVARFALPFGMVAVAKAARSNFLFGSSPIVTQVQPIFANGIAGGDQISFQAALPRRSIQFPLRSVFTQTTSPSFPGATTLLDMSIGGLVEPGTVLERQGEDFRKDFQGSTSGLQKVPVTRVDISGFGESIFSDWSTKPPNDMGISKVSLNVLMGRTAKEVVQVNSILAPYGIHVVRTYTIERLNNGIVIWHDSGWQATSSGIYDYGSPDVITHIGIVHRVTDVTNIRDLDGDHVKFDCILHLESGGLNNVVEVPARDHLGYVIKRADPPAPIQPDDYFEILNSAPLGGPIDFVADIGGSGQKMRITHITVVPSIKSATADDPLAKTAAVIAAWGSVVLPGDAGQWSFIRKAATDEAHKAVDSLKGVPLIREGANVIESGAQVLNSISLANAYQFADPQDLLSTAKSAEYALLHSGDSHRLAFPAPIIKAGDTIKNIACGIPLLADSFALGVSSSIFPPLDKVIHLNTLGESDRFLKILDGGHFQFDLPQIPGVDLTDPTKLGFPLPPVTRTLVDGGQVLSQVRTAGKLALDAAGDIIMDPVTGVKEAQASLNLAINTANKIKDMEITNLSSIALSKVDPNGVAAKEMNRVVGSLKDKAGELAKMANPEHVFGEAMAEVKKLVSFLDNLGTIPNLKISMTNEWAIEISTSMGLEDFLSALEKNPATAGTLVPLIRKFVAELTFSLKARASMSGANVALKMHVVVKVSTGFGPMAIGVAGFDMSVGTDGITVKLDLGVGIGVDFSVGPLNAMAYYSQTQNITKSGDTFGIGATAVVKAHVDLVVAETDLCIEASLMMLGGTCSAHDPHRDQGTSIWAWATVSIAVDVSIFWVIDFHVHEEAQWESRIKGPCALELMGGHP